MRTRKYINDRAELAKEGKCLLQSSEQLQYASKLTLAIIVIDNPGKERIISELSGIPVRTLNHWVTKVDTRGFASLKDQHSTGRPTVLTLNQKAKLNDVLSDSSLKYGYDKWTGKTLKDYIAQNYHCDLGLRQCQRILMQKKRSAMK